MSYDPQTELIQFPADWDWALIATRHEGVRPRRAALYRELKALNDPRLIPVGWSHEPGNRCLELACGATLCLGPTRGSMAEDFKPFLAQDPEWNLSGEWMFAGEDVLVTEGTFMAVIEGLASQSPVEERQLHSHLVAAVVRATKGAAAVLWGEPQRLLPAFVFERLAQDEDEGLLAVSTWTNVACAHPEPGIVSLLTIGLEDFDRPEIELLCPAMLAGMGFSALWRLASDSVAGAVPRPGASITTPSGLSGQIEEGELYAGTSQPVLRLRLSSGEDDFWATEYMAMIERAQTALADLRQGAPAGA